MPYVFTSERSGPIGAAGFRKQLAHWGEKAQIEKFPYYRHYLIALLKGKASWRPTAWNHHSSVASLRH